MHSFFLFVDKLIFFALYYYMSKKITDKELIDNLVELKEKLGRVPKKKDLSLKNKSKYSINAYKRAFRTLANALIAANLKPHQVRNLNNKEKILKDVKNVYNLLGRTPSHREYKQYSLYAFSIPTLRKIFGSWTKTLIAANIPIINAGKVDKIFVLNELKKWYKKNNYDINSLSYWNIRRAKYDGIFPFCGETIKNQFSNKTWEEIMQQIDPLYKSTNQFIQRASHQGKDGQIYLSLIELEVANYLFEFKQQNKIQNYKYEKPICSERQWTCDFYIIKNDESEIWLEVDGMRRNRNVPYNSGENEKIQYYIEKNMEYVILSYNRANIKQFLEYIL